MKIVTIIFASIAIFIALCQMTCGISIRHKGTDEAGKLFHTRLGISSVISGVVTAILAIVCATN